MKLAAAATALTLLSQPASGQVIETDKALAVLSSHAVQASEANCAPAEFLRRSVLTQVLTGITNIKHASAAAPELPHFPRDDGWRSKRQAEKIKAEQDIEMIDYIQQYPVYAHGQRNQITVHQDKNVNASGHFNIFPLDLLRDSEDIRPSITDRYNNVKTYSGEVTPRANLSFGGIHRSISLKQGDTTISQSCYPGRQAISTQINTSGYSFSAEQGFVNPVFCNLNVSSTTKAEIEAILTSVGIELPAGCEIDVVPGAESQ